MMKPATEVEVGGAKYRINRLDAMKQMHVVRRLAPMFKAIAEAMQSLGGVSVKFDELIDSPQAVEALNPLADALAQMRDEDADYIVGTCLDACLRQAAPNVDTWTPVRVNKNLAYQDIELPQMLTLTWHVLTENLARFFPSRPSPDTVGSAPKA